MAGKYRVRRETNGDHSIQLKASGLPECRAVLESIAEKWRGISDVPLAYGGQPYVVKVTKYMLIVTEGERVVDKYVVEAV
jgi:hypothetical protein